MQMCADNENSLLLKLNPTARTSQVGPVRRQPPHCQDVCHTCFFICLSHIYIAASCEHLRVIDRDCGWTGSVRSTALAYLPLTLTVSLSLLSSVLSPVLHPFPPPPPPPPTPLPSPHSLLSSPPSPLCSPLLLHPHPLNTPPFPSPPPPLSLPSSFLDKTSSPRSYSRMFPTRLPLKRLRGLV